MWRYAFICESELILFVYLEELKHYPQCLNIAGCLCSMWV